jgi:hypothetical protein
MVPAREGRPVDEVYMKDKLLLGALSLRAFGPMSFEYLQLAWARRNPRAREQGLNRRSRGERYRSEGLSVCSVVTPVLSPRPVRPTSQEEDDDKTWHRYRAGTCCAPRSRRRRGEQCKRQPSRHRRR